MREFRVDGDAAIAQIAGCQHGVVTRAQLQEAGIGRSAITRRVERGRLHRVHHGVYAVGHAALGNEGRWMAAVLACGPGAVLSHRSAAELWGLLDPAPGPVHVSVRVAGGRQRRFGIQIHRIPSLLSAATTHFQGIAVTTATRTLTDLQPVLAPGLFARVVRQAEIRGLAVDTRTLVPDRTASELERLFLRLVRRHRLPEPEVNATLAGLRVDFLWRAQRLVVETDGYRYHAGSAAFEDDRRRDNRVMELGYDVLRFTYRRVKDEPQAVAALVRQRLLDA
jgi:very-short-patch-repair endonuclease